MVREFEVSIRVTIDSKCKDSDDDIIITQYRRRVR